MTLSRQLGWVLGISQLTTWGLTYYVPAIATRPVAASFGVSTTSVLGGFSAALLATGLLSPLVGRQIEQRGGRPVLALASMVQAAGLLMLAASPGLLLWYAGWLVLGAGMAGGLYDAAFATTGRILGSAARPAITGITLVGGFASTLGWPLGAALIPLLGWRMTLAAYAALLLAVNLPLFLLFVPREDRAAPLPAARPAGGPAPASIAFAAMAAFFTLRAVISTVVSVSAPSLLAELGLGLAEAVAVAALIGPAQVSTRLLQVAAGDRWSPLATSWLGGLLLPLVTVLLVGAALTPGIGAYAGALLFVLGYGMSNGILTISRGTLPLHVFGPQGYAVRIGRMAMPIMLAQAAAPLLTAPLISAWPAQWVFLLLGAVSLLAVACLLPLRSPS